MIGTAAGLAILQENLAVASHLRYLQQADAKIR